MYRYLIDASAIVTLFANNPREAMAKKAMGKLLKLKQRGEALLFIPNFCMAESSKAFARLAFGTKRDFNEACTFYDKLVDSLLEIVSKDRKGMVRSIALNRKHLVNVENIFKCEQNSMLRGHKHLSGLDALIITMGRAMNRGHREDSVYVVTNDQSLAYVCNRNQPEFPKALYILKDPIPG